MAGGTEPSARTVCGDIAVTDLGITYPHEHLLCDLTLPPDPRTTASDRRRALEPLTLANHYWARRHHPAVDLQLLEVSEAISELAHFTNWGGRSLVDATSIGIGRDPIALREISERSGVNIIMGSGYYYSAHHPADLGDRSTSSIATEIISDIVDGVGDTGIRSGIIGEIGLSWPEHPNEIKVLRAAAQAQVETGAALLVHPGRARDAPMSHLQLLLQCGVPPTKIIMSHVDRTLFRTEDFHTLAQTGCYLEFDQFGQESHFYLHAPNHVDIPTDATRVDHIVDLIAAGFIDQILISQDVCHKTTLRKYGGEGYSHLLENVVPLMMAKGMTAEHIHQIMVGNTQRVLALTSA